MSTAQPKPDWKAIARTIDHTLLKSDAPRNAIVKLCEEALQYGFHSICVQPSNVEVAAGVLCGSPIKIASVIGFPQGATLSAVKRFEAEQVVGRGAHELDMVINIGALKSGDRELVRDDVAAVVEVAHASGATVKVIIETCLLTEAEKVLACELSLAAAADYVKTSTGMAGAGATVDDVRLMRRIVGDRAGVKAAGGIRNAADAAAMLTAGASRLGTSASVAIVRELGAD